MWQCECGEFNNEEFEFCVSCARARLADSATESNKKQLTTRRMFRRIQDFILFDIAFCAMVALYCFFVEDIVRILPSRHFGSVQVPQALKTTLPIILIILFQVLLLINVLRMLYNSALNTERNNLFLQRIYQMLREKEDEKKKPKSK